MRIVATSDTHHRVKPQSELIPDGDVFIHGGDLMRTGYPDEWQGMLDWLGDLPHKVKLYVPGNHDFHLQVYPGPALQDLRNVGVTCLGLPGNHNFETYKLESGHRVLGLPYVTGLPRWAFNADEETLRKVVGRYMSPRSCDIVVSHAPVYKYLDEPTPGNHVGLVQYRLLMETMKPKHWIHGHIHECYGTKVVQLDHDADCTIHNVAMCNRDYVHTNPAAVIDL